MDLNKGALDVARRVGKENAYCPYSNFHVGASAFFDDNGPLGAGFFGTNIENASYGLTICAERVAIFSGVSAGYRKLSKVVVSCADATEDQPDRFKTPCGACRQVIQEFAINDQIPIIIDGVGEFTLEQLLPMGFKL